MTFSFIDKDSSGRQIVDIHGPFFYGSYVYAVGVDYDTMNLCVYRSDDSGATWSLESGTGPSIYSELNSSWQRHFGIGAVLDGSDIRIVYQLGGVSREFAYITHVAYDLTGGGWGTPDSSSDPMIDTSGSNDGLLWPGMKACRWPAGGIACLYRKRSVSGGWSRARLAVYTAGSWVAAQSVKDGVYTNSGIADIVPADSGGAHVFITYGAFGTDGITYVPVDSSAAQGTHVGVAGGTLQSGQSQISALKWNQGGTEYIGVAYEVSTQVRVCFAAVGASFFYLKTAYTRDAGTELALGGGKQLAHRNGSLHVFFNWFRTGATKIYSTCIPFADLTASFSAATELYTLNVGASDYEAPYAMYGQMVGSEFRAVWGLGTGDSGGGTVGEAFAGYITHTPSGCVACCCSNFAY